MSIIEINHLIKQFKEIRAVNGVDMEIEEGECFGLLGPNGAGKTSLIRILTAVSPATGGGIRVGDKDLRTHTRDIKATMGVVPQIDNLDPDLTVCQNLVTFARYFNISRPEARRRALEVLKLFELETRQSSPIKELSGGMRRRLLIARGLINMPRILVLDEPTIGLDPQAKYLVWHKLVELKAQGVTQVLCTQNMEEAEELCDRVAIMNVGQILCLDTPEALVSTYVGREIGEIKVRPEDRESTIERLRGFGVEFERVGSAIYIFHLDRDASGKNLADFDSIVRRRTGTLEDVFLKLTGRSLLE